MNSAKTEREMTTHTEPDSGSGTPGSGEKRRSRRDDALFVSVTLGLMAVLGAIVAWGVSDADREARRSLIADTREPQMFRVSVGWFSEAGAVEEFAAYFPSTLKVHAGDTVRFVNPTVEDPHSVTFGLRPDRSNQPLFGTGEPLPVINAPCVSDRPLTPTARRCDETLDISQLPPFSGQPFFNSGIIPPGNGSFDLKLSPSLAPGRYSFFCVIHPSQVGTIDVVARGLPTQRPNRVADAARDLLDEAQDDIRAIQDSAESGELERGPGQVLAGKATELASLNKFFPSDITIDAGQTVTWTNDGPVPHVMIFDGYLPPPEASEAGPSAPSGSALTPGLFTSGPIGAAPYPRTRYTLRFTNAGRYAYVCTFHPGMTGTVVVR